METGGKTARELNATGGRIGYKDGPKMNRRTFMKYLAGFVSLPIIGKIVKPLKTVKGVKNVPIIKTGDVPGKPEWFDALINKVIIEGDDVTKKFATQDRQVVYSKKIDADNEVTVYRDLDTDSVRVDYSSPDVMLDEPVSLSYTRGQADEATQGMKPADEFETFEQGLAVRSNGPDDYSIDPEPSVGSSISSLETDVSKLKEYATGKKPTMKEFIASKKRRDRVQKINEGDIGEISDYATQRQGDYYDYDDYASGGIARMLGERPGYQMGGDVAYDATNKDIYESSAATFTPDTVMDQFGNQVQAELGNDFNKPLIPQVTDQAANKPPDRVTDMFANDPRFQVNGGLTDIPAAGGMGEIDMPVAGGNNNAGGILPVMPQLPGFRDDTNSKRDVPQGGMNFTEKSPNMSDEDIMKGFAEFQKQNPDIMNRPSTQAIVNLTLPGGTPMSFNSGAGAAALRQYLQSIGMEAGPGQGMGEPLKKAVQPGGTLAALSSGGIARMLGE
jgi:hypothetical protein